MPADVLTRVVDDIRDKLSATAPMSPEYRELSVALEALEVVSHCPPFHLLSATAPAARSRRCGERRRRV